MNSFTARIASYLMDRPQQWVRATDLEFVGGRQAWRTRLSEARQRYGITIENRVRRMTREDGTTWKLSEYRYVPRQTQPALFEDLQSDTKSVESA